MIQEKKTGKLENVEISVKDCICVKGMETTASSKILKGYVPIFHATAVQRVLNEGAIITEKTVQDEFGFGSFCTNVSNGEVPKNPVDETRVCGGSSGGSARLTKLSKNHISLAESTGGSIACPAAFCGVIGLTPTYGRVSRYGLLDYGSSLDKIGVMANTVDECKKVLEIISGKDENDSTSLDAPTEIKDVGISKIKVGVLKVSCTDEVKESFEKNVEKLKELCASVETVELPLTMKYGISAYYVIALSEASTNLAKYCGMRYGVQDNMNESFNDYFTRIRSENLGKEAKRRVLLGTFARMSGYRDAFYVKAAKVRTKIIEEYKEAFKKFDVIVCPTMPCVAPTFDEVHKLTPLQHYEMDVLTVGPNLAGLPHISVPMGEGLPKGFMIISDHLKEENILGVANVLQ